jgi:hypothetical protein
MYKSWDVSDEFIIHAYQTGIQFIRSKISDADQSATVGEIFALPMHLYLCNSEHVIVKINESSSA